MITFRFGPAAWELRFGARFVIAGKRLIALARLVPACFSARTKEDGQSGLLATGD
jgi:hypothetical protein